LDQAIEYFNKSLLEDYNEKTKTLLKKIEEERKKQADAAYIDPVKSEEHKRKGNELYAEGKFAEAIVEYTEALKRDPTNYKVYSNRAACRIKLMDWARGLEDCEKCISMDPTFVKAYIRKGKIQHFLKQYHKALTTYEQALQIDPKNEEVLEARRSAKHAREHTMSLQAGLSQRAHAHAMSHTPQLSVSCLCLISLSFYLSLLSATMIAIQNSEADPERAKEAMKDPEIQAILRDPTISKVLQDMQNNPQSGQASVQRTIMHTTARRCTASLLHPPSLSV
jgi:tetratricopeptide (TPR) repeat protein